MEIIIKCDDVLKSLAVNLGRIADAYDKYMPMASGAEAAEAQSDLAETASAPDTNGNSETTTPSGDWNPRTSEVQGRYGADKLEALKAVATEMGVEFAKSWPGAKIHQAILDAADDKAETAMGGENDAEERVGGAEPEEESKTEAPPKGGGKEKLRTLLREAAGEVGKDKVMETMKSVAGTAKVDELTKENGPKVVKAIEALLSGDEENGDW